MKLNETPYGDIRKTRLFVAFLSVLVFVTFAILANSYSFLVLVALGLEIYKLVSLIKDLKLQLAYRKDMALARIQTPEKIENLYVLPTKYSFRSKEESEINAQFLEFLKYKNKVYSVSSHLTYLIELADAFHIVKREKEAYDLQPRIKSTREKLKKLEGQAPKYKSRYNDLFYGMTDVSTAYMAYSSSLSSVDFYGINEFFQDSYVKLTKTENDTAFAFTPAYVIVCERPSEGLKICRYSNLICSSEFYLEKLKGPKKPKDEVHHMGYKYEKKDGTRDQRYSSANNPTVPYVYRGNVFISCTSGVLDLRFPNRSSTVSFTQNYAAYSNLITNTYALLINKLLEHDERLDDYNDLNAYLVVIKEEELQKQQEKERRIKLEEEARLRRQEQERQKRAEEERRKAEAAKAEQARLELRRQRWAEEDRRRAEAAKAEEERQKRELQEYKERARKKQEEEARRLVEKKEKELAQARQEKELAQARQEKELEAKRSKEEIKKAQKLAEQESKKRAETERELQKVRDQAAREALKREEMERELRRVRSQASDLSGLSEEERAMILEMRKKRRQSGTVKTSSPVSRMSSQPPATERGQSTKSTAAKPGTSFSQSASVPKSPTSSAAAAPKTEYVLQPFDSGKVRLSLREDKRRITNNIFSLVFEQNSPVGPDLLPAEYEAFVADSDGRVISNIKTISADKTEKDLTQKVSLSLSTQEKFDKQADYYVILRYKGAGNKVLSKTKYQINIAFASDFDDF